MLGNSLINRNVNVLQINPSKRYSRCNLNYPLPAHQTITRHNPRVNYPSPAGQAIAHQEVIAWSIQFIR